MTELADKAADGALPYQITPERTREMREALGPDKLLVVEHAVALGADQDLAARRAHAHVDHHLSLPNYRGSWLRQGFDESDLVPGGSERLVRALVATVGPAAVAARIAEHLEAGADHVLLCVVGDGLVDDPRPGLRDLAGALGLA